MDQVSVLGGAVEASQPRQGLLNFIGVESCSTEFATQERQFGTNVTTPVVFVHVYENIEHGRNIPCFEIALADALMQGICGCFHWP
jgi:hypothetical protein